ncbi:MAG: cyclic nucleotide-binding domain-containing protein [Pseudobutyrivibrio sp.]|nr:cyclic nucleotide-binding domain-containing protein [Pseudobutyrivibrio sp.]
MDITSVEKGKKLIAAGDKVNRMYVVYTGSVHQKWKGHTFTLGPGTVVGLSDALNETYESSYVVAEDSTLFPSEYTCMADLYTIFEASPVFIFGYAKGAFRQCRDVFTYSDEVIEHATGLYAKACELYKLYEKKSRAVGAPLKKLPLYEDMEPLEMEESIKEWERDYISCLNSIDNKNIESIYGKEIPIVAGVIGICGGYMKRAMDTAEMAVSYAKEFAPVLFEEGEFDLFGFIFELQVYCAQRGLPYEDLTAAATELYNWAKDTGFFDSKLLSKRWETYSKHDFAKDATNFDEKAQIAQAQLDDCLGHICEFAGIESDKTEKYREAIAEYLALPDKEDREDAARKARKKATDAFYEIYEKVFFACLETEERTDVVEMFLHFGFIDQDAIGADNAAKLKEMVVSDLEKINTEHVFTIYSWLMAIYEGKREPSRNELDLDYRGFVLEERKNGNIPEDKVNEYMNNLTEKVKFEMANFFKSANRTTSGKMTSFCPILTADDFAADPGRMMITEQSLQEALEKIESVDFGIFYREAYFVDAENGIKSELYMKKVEPDIILLPNCGMRAMMWQECGGIKVDSPGRFVFPLFTMEDLNRMMIYCCGAFRWEICRKENGSRWNDIASECLTSEFYDYFTFYRKNHDLSAEQKEKVKTLLKSSRNNMREAFTREYTIWVNFESQGSIRLNKAERDIFAKFCPFAKKYRKPVESHPLFEASITRYNTKTSQALHHLKTVFDKYEKQTGTMPEEIAQCIEFYKS